MTTAEDQATTENQLEEVSRIDEKVIREIVRTAAKSVTGVADISEGNPIKNITGIFGQSQKARGVLVTSGVREAIVDVNLIVNYGNPIPEIMDRVRAEVRRAVREMCGLDAKVVNVVVVDIRFEAGDPVRAAMVA